MENWITFSSVHGLNHFAQAGYRKYRFRLFWAFIFVTVSFTLIYFQLKLFYEIAVKKPTVVERYYERKKTLNFPNVVICDMNQEYNNVQMMSSGLTGGMDLIRFAMQLSLNLLYEPIKVKFQHNITKTAQEIPVLSEQYKQLYQNSEPEWTRIFSKF